MLPCHNPNSIGNTIAVLMILFVLILFFFS